VKTVAMTRVELKELIESWENLHYLVTEISQKPEYYRLLMEVALYDIDPKSWRAAYQNDKINDNQPELLLPFLNEIIEQVQTETSSSKKRHFLKLISFKNLTKKQQGFLFDFCIKTLTSDEPVAVRVHAMQILYNIAEIEHELIPEIILIIENEVQHHSTAGIITRGRKLSRKLEKLQKKLQVKKQRDKNNS
jgi:hypothetical protein